MKNYPHYFLTTILIFGNLVTHLSIALAETKKADFTIDSNGISSYRNLMQQAEDRAERAIATEFANNPELAEITVTILGERRNRIVPLLLVKVSRSQWEEGPEMEKWTRYLRTSEVLLGFRDTEEENPASSLPPPPPPSQTTPTDSPPSPPQTTPDSSPQTAPPPSSPTDTRSPSPTEERERRLEEDPAFRDD